MDFGKQCRKVLISIRVVTGVNSMSETILLQLNTIEVCQLINTDIETITEIVAYGIVSPITKNEADSDPSFWVFKPQVITTLKKAIRLHNDLELDWAGIAFAIDLISDLEQLRNENTLLKQRLSRFLHE